MRHHSWLRAALTLVLLLALPMPAFADRDDEEENDDSAQATHDCHRACMAYIDVRISEFLSSGADAPSTPRVFVGRTETFSDGAGLYRIPLTDGAGNWRNVDFDRRHLNRNGLPKGAVVIVPLGHGRVLQGVYGFMSRGQVSMKVTTTVLTARLLGVKNYSRARFERQGDRRYVPGNPGQDEFFVNGNVITSYSTVTSHGDFSLARLTCRGGVDLCSGTLCAAKGQCRDVGVCDPASGLCSNPMLADGTPCNDQNACTQTDSCQKGTCVGANPIACPAGDQCRAPGACDAKTGACESQVINEGLDCADGNACTQGDKCRNGVCSGSPVVCEDKECSQSSCHTLLGCVYTPDDSRQCTDGNACTQSDYCFNGHCQSGSQTACATPAVCHDSGVCNASTGQCEYTVLSEGTSCGDGVYCNGQETCQSGVCTPGVRPLCVSSNPCVAAYCDEQAAGCVTANVVAGTTCGNGYACNNQGSCADVNECTSGANNCHVNAECTNTAGGFTCACKTGYTGNGVVCTQSLGGVIDPTARAGSMTLRAAPNGKLIVVYADTAGSAPTMKVASYDGAWSLQVAVQDADFASHSAAVDAQGFVHAAFSRADGLYYGTNASGTWVSQTIPGVPLNAHGGATADLDDDGFFHVTSSQHVQAPGRYYATNRGGTWVASQVAPSATNTAAIVAAGVPSPVLAHAEWGTHRIDLMTAPNWSSKQLIYQYGVDQGPSISMAVDRGVPMLAYGILPGGYGSLSVLLEVRQSNGTWARTTLASGVTPINAIDLAVDEAGHRFVTTNDTAGAMKVYSDMSGAWVATSLGSSAPGPIDTLVRAGVYYLVYAAPGASLLTMLTRNTSTL